LTDTHTSQLAPIPHVLITGATGFVGRALLNRFQADSSLGRPHLALRSDPSNDFESINCSIVGNINSQTDWQDVLRGTDIVVHLAARVHVMDDVSDNPLMAYRDVNVGGTLELLRQSARAGVKRFIFLSSIKVNGEETIDGNIFSEDSAPNPMDPYGVSKFEAEEGIKDFCKAVGVEYVIIRPPLIYGPGVKANYRKLLDVIYRGIPLPFACIHNRRSMLALGNLVDFLRVALTHPRAANQTFLLSDGEDLSSKELVEKISVAMGKRSRLIPLPVSMLKLIGTLFGKSQAVSRLLGSLQIDSSKAREYLNWKPPLTTQEGITLTVNDFLVGKDK
jgi:nucleoside-diphosphate-sugar epimerase